MLIDNVIAGIAIGVFSFVSVIVFKLAAIAVHLTLKNSDIGNHRLGASENYRYLIAGYIPEHPSEHRGGNR
jgi:hypothetical protein